MKTEKQRVNGDSDLLITVETEVFDHREIKANFINPCCFGEDFATWLKKELAPLADSGFILSGVIQEDYGWGFWARHGKDPLWVAVSYVGDDPQEAPAHWGISVNYDPGLNLMKRLFHKPDRNALEELRHKVLDAVASNDAIRAVPAPRYGCAE